MIEEINVFFQHFFKQFLLFPPHLTEKVAKMLEESEFNQQQFAEHLFPGQNTQQMWLIVPNYFYTSNELTNIAVIFFIAIKTVIAFVLHNF